MSEKIKEHDVWRSRALKYLDQYEAQSPAYFQLFDEQQQVLIKQSLVHFYVMGSLDEKWKLN